MGRIVTVALAASGEERLKNAWIGLDDGDQFLLFLERGKECGNEIRKIAAEFLYRLPGAVALVE